MHVWSFLELPSAKERCAAANVQQRFKQFVAVCSGLEWFPARPLRGGYRPPPRTPKKEPLAGAPETLFGGSG
eukprot:12812913-Alexandrium_andersonii.AAC.1